MKQHALAQQLVLATGLAVLSGGVVYHLCRAPHQPTASEPACCAEEGSADSAGTAWLPAPAPELGEVTDLSRPLTIPDTVLLDQYGRKVRFYTDLVKGRVVVINFIFTTCKGVCPPMGATFGKLGQDPNEHGIQLISVSVDPVNDTSERLAEWAQWFGASSEWALVTGTKQDIDGLLKSLDVFSADKANHSPFLLLGNDRTGTWRRMHGLSPIETIRTALRSLRRHSSGSTETRTGSRADPAQGSPALHYFTDVALVNQHGESMRLYSDLFQGKVVVIHVFFVSCRNTCPHLLATYQKLQEHLGARLGRDVHLLSLTVDPDNDSQAVLKDCAERLGARRGWYLLTGSRDNLELALGKLGLAAAQREGHSNHYIIGKEPTQLWKKVNGLAPVDQIIDILDGVIADPGAASEG